MPRTHLVQLLSQGRIPYRKVGAHRRVRTEDVLAYRRETESRRREALDELTTRDQELGRIRPLLSQHLGLRRARVVQSAVHQAPDDFEAKVQKAADDNRITGEQEHRLVATDLILQARSSRDANPVWIAVEVANRIDGAAAVLIPVGNGWWRRRSFCAAPISRRPPRTR